MGSVGHQHDLRQGLNSARVCVSPYIMTTECPAVVMGGRSNAQTVTRLGLSALCVEAEATAATEEVKRPEDLIMVRTWGPMWEDGGF